MAKQIKWESPETKGLMNVYAVITPDGKFLSIDIQHGNDEAEVAQQIRIPWKIIEREYNKV